MAALKGSHALDRMSRKILGLAVRTRFYEQGWGLPATLQTMHAMRRDILSTREEFQKLVLPADDLVLSKPSVIGGCLVAEGHFTSPFARHFPGILPVEAETSRFQLVLPEKQAASRQPIVIQFAGTGDHGFWKRRVLSAQPLARETGVGSILVENPYYGTRKPKEQFASFLCRVTDLYVMGAALALETQAMINWAENEGFGPFSLHGISMGGFMACIGASLCDKPVGLAPCLVGVTSAGIWSEGALRQALAWDKLEASLHTVEQYLPGLVAEGATSAERTVGTMRNMMNEFTDLRRYPRPAEGAAVVVVNAGQDGYVPPMDRAAINELYTEGQYLDLDSAGHLTSYFLRQNAFRAAVVAGLERLNSEAVNVPAAYRQWLRPQQQ